MVGPISEVDIPVAEEIERRETTPAKGKGPDRRKDRVDRRTGMDRRQKTAAETGYSGPERRVAERREDTGLERRRGPGRRLSDERKTAEEGEMNELQFEFVMAVELYKKLNKRLYPTLPNCSKCSANSAIARCCREKCLSPMCRSLGCISLNDEARNPKSESMTKPE